MDILKFNSVEEKIITVRGISVILDSDVAELYGVETRDINKAVKNNPGKFPEGYLMEINQNEKIELVENFHRFNKLKHSTVFPTAFTEKGLYMLATILKSPKATQTTIAIVEAFAKIRELSRAVSQLSETDDEPTQKSLMQRSSEIIADFLGDGFEATDAETSFELNLALMKFKRTVRQKKR
jgi:phage regulator Rha-like protein